MSTAVICPITGLKIYKVNGEEGRHPLEREINQAIPDISGKVCKLKEVT